VAVAPGGDWIATGSEAGEVRVFARDGEALGAGSVDAAVQGLGAAAGLLLVAHHHGHERWVSAFRVHARRPV
jgi:hypothetical protein